MLSRYGDMENACGISYTYLSRGEFYLIQSVECGWKNRGELMKHERDGEFSVDILNKRIKDTIKKISKRGVKRS